MIYTNVYECCTIEIGKGRGAIFDLERGSFVSLPLEICSILKKNDNIDFERELKSFNVKNKKILRDILKFLLNNDFVYQTNNSIRKKEREAIYNSSFHIESYIIDFLNIEKALTYFNTVKDIPDVESLQVRIFDKVNFYELEKLMAKLKIFSSQSIEIILKNKNIKIKEYQGLLKQNFHISRLFILDSSYFKTEMDNRLIFLKDTAIGKKSCGKISESLFQINRRTAITSKSCNSCLNRKISIDENGEIKNCPSMPNSYGNINDTTIAEAINKPGFRKYWNITKNDIEVCRDCEFRNVCTDCRAYTERNYFNKEGLDLSKPLKCGYNPYTNEWSEWSSNPLKQKAIEYYGIRDLILD